MNMVKIVIYDGYVDERTPEKIFCSGCIVSSVEGSVILSRSPFEAMEGFVSVINETQNFIYVPPGSDAAAMAEALFSIGGFTRVPKKSTLEDFFKEKIEDYSCTISVTGDKIPNIALEITRFDLKRRLILKCNEGRSMRIILEDCNSRE